ncbi:MAG TPA: hypothetical protein VFD15_06540 [Clostridia bacterium]|nr:hypothetical protein [Clostridia bacterium]
MITPGQLARYKAGWGKSREKRKQELENRYDEARKCAKRPPNI